MARLDKLLEELCPDGVEYVKLGEVCDYEQPTKYIVKSTDYNDDFKLPVLTAGESFILGYIDETEGIYEASKNNPVIIFDDFTTSFHWVDFDFKVKSSAMKMLKLSNKTALFRYIYHCMRNIKFAPSGHRRRWIREYSEIAIPLPPLPVQEEIVRILDNFTELTAELTAREKQYEYYRDELLTFGDEVRREKLKDIAEIGTGSSNTNEQIEDGKYPFYVRSQEVRTKNEYEFDETAIITSGDGVGVGKIYHFVEGKYALHQRAYRIHIVSNEVMPKYYYHYMKTKFLAYIERTSYHSSVTSIRRAMLNNFPIPIPPLAEQERIVSILDKFDALVNDISIGLPAEIEVRQKQYEYYREKLLTFKELKAKEA